MKSSIMVLVAVLLLGAMFPMITCGEGKIAVAVLKGDGVGPNSSASIKRLLGADPRFTVRDITGAEIGSGGLQGIAVLVLPGGLGHSESELMGPAGRQAVKDFLRNGGGYLGFCAGAYLATQDSPGNLALTAVKVKSPLWRRGEATLNLALTPAGKAILPHSEAENIPIHYENGPVVENAPTAGLPPIEVLAVFKTETAENGTPAGVQIGSPAIWSAKYGNGRVVVSSAHPELTDTLHSWVAPLALLAAGKTEAKP